MPPVDYTREDFEIHLRRAEGQGYEAIARWEGIAGIAGGGPLPLDPQEVARLRQAWVVGNTAAEAGIADRLYQALADAVPALESWLQGHGPLYRGWQPSERFGTSLLTYKLPRLRLGLEARELIALPWEAMVDLWNIPAGTLAWDTPTMVVRGMLAVPFVAGVPLEMPLHLAQVTPPEPEPGSRNAFLAQFRLETFDLPARIEEIFGHYSGPAMEQVVQTWQGADLDGLPWKRTDLLHLTVVSCEPGPVLKLDGGRRLSARSLMALLADQATRLLVLQVPGRRSVLAQLLEVAHDLAQGGGPPVLVVPLGPVGRHAREFFDHFYDQLIHDTPFDFAALLLEPDSRLYADPPDQRWLRAGLALVAGLGGEDLLRFSSLLYGAEDRRRELAERASLQRQWAAGLQEIFQVLSAPPPSLPEPEPEPEPPGPKTIVHPGGTVAGVIGAAPDGTLRVALRQVDVPRIRRQLEEQVARFADLENQLGDLKEDLSFEPTEEGESSIPMVRRMAEMERLEGELQTASEDMVESVAQRSERVVNTWFVAGRSARGGRALRREDRLDLHRPHLLHVDIGPPAREGMNILRDPVDLGAILEPLYAGDQQGVTLEVALFSQDFWVGPAQEEPAVPHTAWRRPPSAWPTVDHLWERPSEESAVQHVWLSRLAPSRPLYFSLWPRRPGLGRLRLCVYCRNNLLQSLLLEARVVRAGAEERLDQLPGIGRVRSARLAGAGLAGLGALAAADREAVAETARVGGRAAERWIEIAGKLATLGTEGRVEYTTTADFVGIQDTPQRAVSIFTNSDGTTHLLGVKVGTWDEEWGRGDDWTRAIPLAEREIENAIRIARGSLTQASSVLLEGVPRRYAYNLKTNAGTPIRLGQALYRLAQQGRQLYSKFFDYPVQQELEKRLREERQTIHVARLVGTFVIPWAILYDRPLSYDQPQRDKYVCLGALAPGASSPCPGCPGGDPAAVAGATRIRALEKGKHPDGVNLYLYEDPSLCLLAAHPPKDVVCPWGFWGFKHLLEQPPQRLPEEEDPAPRSLKRAIQVRGQPVVSMNVSTTLDFVKDNAHKRALERLQLGGRPMLKLRYAGKDELTAAGTTRPGVDGVLDALRSEDLSAIYFYCHGGPVYSKPSMPGEEPVPIDAFLAVGSSDEQRIRPVTLDNEEYLWPNGPLVFINACKSVALEPGLLGDFVDKFAQHGAAGVIGTEVSVWEPLATWAAEFFFQRLFAAPSPGQAPATVGDLLLEMRRALLRQYNPLGLIYTNYCATDLRAEVARY